MVNGKTGSGNGREHQKQFEQDSGGPVETGQDTATGEAVAEQEAAGAEDAAELDKLREEVTLLSEKAQANLELAQRTQAEMENLRKRTARDIESAHKFALERFVADLLPVIDSLELGLQASDAAADVASLREGMDLTLKKFTDLLVKFGVTEINPDGEKFNPEKHDAVSMTEVEGAEPGTVITVLQKGYELNGRLVRPAMVVVAGKGQQAGAGEPA